MLKLHSIPKGLGLFSPAFWLASFFGSGLLRPASGTWGSLLAFILAIIILIEFNKLTLFILSITLFFIGLWASTKWLAHDTNKDPSAIVIDEAAGLFLTLSLLPYSHQTSTASLTLLLGFGFFRLFDILKPWPVSYADKQLSGALGVMLDDILAGLMAAGASFLVLKGLIYVF
ncbi:MAG: phosphatidylglycerophosphatase A [Parvibaculales bacterium]